MKILLIGQAPSYNGNPSAPLSYGPTASKIIKLLGIHERRYFKRFDRINILDYWLGKFSKGDKFPMREAKRTARIKSYVISGRRILFVGLATARAFGFDYAPLRWRKFNGGIAAILPHPSGVNKWWNDPANRKTARRFMSSVARLR